MRQLEEILAECRKKAHENWENHKDACGSFMSQDEFVQINSSSQRLDKTEEMYNILTMLESYLQRPSLDGRTDRQDMRKKLKEMLDSL